MNEQKLTERFSTMILGVTASITLTDIEKSYIIELLQDQLKTELICIEFSSSIDPAVANLLEN